MRFLVIRRSVTLNLLRSCDPALQTLRPSLRRSPSGIPNRIAHLTSSLPLAWLARSRAGSHRADRRALEMAGPRRLA